MKNFSGHALLQRVENMFRPIADGAAADAGMQPSAGAPEHAEPRRAPRLGFLGGFGRGNLGADAALEAIVTTVHALRPDADIVCVCDTPGAIETRFPLRGAAMSWVPEHGAARALNRLLLDIPRAAVMLARAVKILSRIDVLIVPGTHLFDDYPPGARSTSGALLVWTAVARALGVRIALVSIGAGPFPRRSTRWLARAIARTAEMRSYRDGASKEHMAATGLAVRHDHVAPDLMFKLPEPKPVNPPPSEGAAMVVGVDVVSRAGWPDSAGRYESYSDKLAAFVHWLLDRGLTVRLLKGDASDDHAIAELADAVTRRRFGQGRERLLSGPAHSIHGLMRQLVETDIVAASHYHVLAGALKLGKPSLSIGLSESNAALLAEMGFPSLSQPVRDIDSDLLIDQFTRLVVDRRAYERGILEVRTDLERRLAEQEARLAELLR